MAIDKLTSPQAVASGTGDWVAAVNLIEKLYLGQEIPVRIDYDNDLVLKGSVFQIGGSVYIATADTSITGTPSDYVKITPGASTATAAYVANLTGVTWNDTYNGYYDGSGNIYIFDEDKAYYDEVITDVYKSDGKRAVNNKLYTREDVESLLYQKSLFYNSAGVGLVATTWTKIPIDSTSYNNITGASIASSQITLPAGRYLFGGGVTFFWCNSAVFRVYNISDSSIVGYSTTTTAPVSGETKLNVMNNAFVEISSSKIFEFQYYVGTGGGSSAIGPTGAYSGGYPYFFTVEKISF